MEPTPDYPDQTTCDVCLSEDSNEIIRTTSKGLNEDSHIGVYVPDILIGDESLFEDLHGTTGLPFGTFEKSGNGDSCLNRFINNRSEGYEAYYGVRKSDSEDAASEYGRYRIYWVDFVCEITDPDGNLLFMSEDATAPALFQYLDKFGAFEALRNHTTFYDKEGKAYSGTDYDVRMLVLEYDLKWNVPVEVPNKGKVTLTMADKSDASLPTSVRKRYDSCGGITTIGRGVSSGSMFTTAQNSNFILKNVTLDGGAEFSGGAWSKGVNVDGALINANGNVTLDDKVLLCNSYSTKNGGAIAYSGPGTLTMNSGSVIDHCKAQNGAVLYVNTAIATETVNIVMAKDALWQNCEAVNGLIGVNAGVLNLSSEFDNKKDNNDTVFNVKDCTSTNGGLAYVSGGTLNVTGTVKDFTAVLGGAIFETGANAKVNISAGEISGNTATGFGGGALRIEGGAQAEISGDALISNNKVEGSGDKYGGAINVKKGTLTISGGTITGNSVISTNSNSCYGGAIHADGSSEVIITGGTITGNQAGSGSRRSLAYGGAISLRNGAAAAISGDTITITGNTVVGTKGYGAGIYLEEGTTLSLSGAPDFGGTDTNADGTILGTYGNFITLVGYSSKTNGQKSYPASNQVRQDIYIAEKHENAPQSIVLTGALTGDDGTIWIWAEKAEHYRQLMPFARLGDGINGGNLKAFRNAQDDTTTENATDTWLYGALGEEGEAGYGIYVYWTGIAGSRKVILRKVSDQYNALPGAAFTIYRGSTKIEGTNINGETTTSFASGTSGVFYIGELNYGVYVLHETTFPSGYSGDPFFFLVVDEDGAEISDTGYKLQEDAQTAGNAEYTNRKTARMTAQTTP